MAIETDILAQIKKYDTIIIHRHQRPDPDAYGSQVGLAEIIRASFPKKKVYQVGEMVSRFDWLVSQDEIEDSVYNDALVIVTDTANRPRVDDERYTKGKYLIKIDHHPNDDVYGDICWVNTQASSCSEIIYDFYAACQAELTLPASAARVLYAGIVGDTGRFMYDATTPHTLRVAAALVETGIDAAQLNRKLDSISEPLARLSAYVLENMVVTKHKAAYVILTREIMAKYNLSDGGTAPVVPLLGKLEEVVCWTVLVEQENHSYRLRIRSKGPVINELAKEYHGGGHPLASGAMLKDASAIETYVEKLDQIAASAAERE
ncbi:DHH family phosphoesterase [Ligilactobacillus agilis]|uniref:Bifunctional oligoribonuclease/PAP phosphatase NrnA n=1 Tax=Ligilactobacillus agilis TaxID=1601 RepID=A0A222W4M1_9LACO|nr:bifunctional oligoribonuclease/PAP phosphatase NrnA [Ligilactobacillus agilis]ASR41104.1 oligoribonuclease [Ligilactobacillus agilis]MDM8279693.1 bifunctional oligoribonuclease/PAP phosphatase NrnA [Ligilactobacillus agilis]PLA77320.1 bifunctional oligoribonuclease/PAP phosphatase NrnA [Ligilactobacillus agilis]PLA82861.1 bifunctional oligoribonuclease/PAP phosphatase NrnA [Ligilactobacillus agilis]HJG04984.1 bifunctional oligoribonuclease/PAP phosphatase NrnA [Ligilactobacillus agilis]